MIYMVFVDNILIADDGYKLADFGQAVMCGKTQLVLEGDSKYLCR